MSEPECCKQGCQNSCQLQFEPWKVPIGCPWKVRMEKPPQTVTESPQIPNGSCPWSAERRFPFIAGKETDYTIRFPSKLAREKREQWLTMHGFGFFAVDDDDEDVEVWYGHGDWVSVELVDWEED